MLSLRTRTIALLLAVALFVGLVHCTLDRECEKSAASTVACQVCLCHAPALAETKPVQLQPVKPVVERTLESVEPNARLACVSIFNPPKA